VLGEGGIGIVYRATHTFLRRSAAVKVLRPDHTTEHDIARFEREVQLTSRLTHPNTVRVYDFGRTIDGLFYYAMELLGGATLADVVNVGGPQPLARVAHIMSQVAGALAEAHDIGLVHRDVKPSNIVLADQGGELDVAKVVDFGLVKDIGAIDAAGLTATNTLVGTPLYLPPEAIVAGGRVDHRGDIYALGAVGYLLLTGSDVFDSGSIVEVCADHLHATPDSLSERLGKRVDEQMEALILSCLAKSPEERPDDAHTLQELLAPIIAAHPWSQREAERWWNEHGTRLRLIRGEEEQEPAPAGGMKAWVRRLLEGWLEPRSSEQPVR
jgi:serine/threonine protein kinase